MRRLFSFLFCLVISNIYAQTICNTATIEIAHGKLCGKVDRTILTNKTFYAFKGIPYAAAPVGDLRFKAPRPVKIWEKTLDASKYGQKCTQPVNPALYDNLDNIEGGEDCLFLNVFTPELPTNETSSKLLPVLFYIHGGAFRTGSGSDFLFGPDFLMEEDVVLVTVNYRIGVLGFLSLENEEVPGNFGLKDLVQALRWVKSNIIRFGGAPNSVTIFGQSTGAVCAHLLMISPLARGLFHKVALQSGNIVTPRGLSSHSTKERAFKLGRILGFNSTDEKKLVQFLRTVPASNLTLPIPLVLKASTIFSEAPELPFPPTIEPTEVGDEAIITSDPVELLRMGQFAKVPLMLGHTNAEYIYFLEVSLTPENLKSIIENLKIGMPLRNIALPYKSEVYKNIVETIRDMYSLKVFSNESGSNYVELQSDIWFNVATELAAQLHSVGSRRPVYFYRFSYQGAFNYGKQVKNVTIPGASHADELCYEFACERYRDLYKTVQPGTRDYKMIKVWSKLYSNFARTGNPTPGKLEILDNVLWLSRTRRHRKILEMDEELKLRLIPRNTKIDQWLEIIEHIKQLKYDYNS